MQEFDTDTYHLDCKELQELLVPVVEESTDCMSEDKEIAGSEETEPCSNNLAAVN